MPVSREADEAKRSGLTEPWTAGQSRVVMATLDAAVLHVSDSQNDRDALVEERQEARRSTAAAVRDSESRCALTIKNACSRRNLTARRGHCTAAGSRGAVPRALQRRCSVPPDERDTPVGRERPPEGRARGEERGSQVGVAHAPLAALLGCDSGADSRPAAQSAAGSRPEVADWPEDKAPVIVQGAMRPLVLREHSGCLPGNGAPDFRFPHPVPPLTARRQQPRAAESRYNRSVKRDAGETLRDALALCTEVRAAPAHSLLDSRDTDVDEGAEAAWATEVSRRVAELDNGTVKTIPWAEVRGRFGAP
jgi:hypothetical protein